MDLANVKNLKLLRSKVEKPDRRPLRGPFFFAQKIHFVLKIFQNTQSPEKTLFRININKDIV
jgi:hypothetical protein